MTDEIEDDDEGIDVDLYEPMPIGLSDGDCVIPDPVEFAERFNALAVINRDCDLFVLDRDSLKWSTVEPKPDTKRGNLKTVN